MPHIYGFLYCFSFGYFQSLLERKTKFIKFWIKQVKFLPSRCTGLTAKLAAFSQKFKKTVRALRVNGQQKHAIHIIFNRNKCAHTSEIFKEQKILNTCQF